jgi:Tfp pilus assembly protein PilX
MPSAASRRPRFVSQDGFTMILVLGVLMVTMLLTAAVFTMVQGDASLSRADLDGKRAYASAQAGLQAYLNGLNTNSSSSAWWETCANDTTSGPVPMPGATTGVTYQYQPVVSCSATNPVGTLIDPTTGTLRMEFTGNAGKQSRTIVAGFRTLSPLSFLWYTVHETVDTSIDSNCGAFYQDVSSHNLSAYESECGINWVSGDVMNGPMYTQDQFLINNGDSPVFGRPGSADAIAAQAGSSNPNAICVANQCYSASVSNPQPNPQPQVSLPSDNSNLLADAHNHGTVLFGTTTLTLGVNSSGQYVATGTNCPSTSSTAACTPESINLSQNPIIYIANSGSACSTSYSPKAVTYQKNSSGNYYGPCGDLYVSGTDGVPLTLNAADDIIITGNLTNSADTNPTGTASPTGSATIGLVANEYVRVMHDGLVSGNCPTHASNPNVTIDAAILTLQHSFFVDNYQCGGTPQGLLTVHGAIIQWFRGIVGQVSSSGYLKNYNYDDRLQVMLPPYLFDLENTEWSVFRETLCTQGAPASSANSCTGS